MTGSREKPITEKKIPGTDVPDVSGIAAADSESQQRWLSRVGVTTAVLAACASVATMFSASYLNKAMLEQIVTSNQWNYYQAKGVKLAVLESRMELLLAIDKLSDEESKRDTFKATEYKDDQAAIMASAKEHQTLAEDRQKRHSRLALASTAFQIAIAMAAVALLTRKNGFWILSVVIGFVGIGVLVFGMFI
ncbi:MAG: DUF4337 domain-containing protein [Phycisphaerales bacterium]